jgi:hypothetical protein
VIRFFLVLFILGGLGQVYAQITNASFEHWQPVPGTSGAEDPVGWTSNNIICDTVAGYAIRKSTVARSGNYALEIRPGCDLGPARYSEIALGVAVVDTLAPNLYYMNGDCSGDSIPSDPPFILAGYYQYKAGSPQSRASCGFSLKSVKCRDRSFITPANHSLGFKLTTSLGSITPYSYVAFAVPLQIQADTLPELRFMEITFYIDHLDTSDNDSRFLLIDDLSLHGNLLTLPKQNLASLIELYPNPVSASLKLEKPDFLSVAKLAVYNTRGELVIKANSWQAQLDFSKLVPGLYLLQLETSAGLVTKRVMKS